MFYGIEELPLVKVMVRYILVVENPPFSSVSNIQVVFIFTSQGLESRKSSRKIPGGMLSIFLDLQPYFGRTKGELAFYMKIFPHL